MLLVDASVWVALAAPEEKYARAAEDLFDSEGQTAALDLTLLEVVNVFAARRREPERAAWLADAIVRRCGERLVRVDLTLLTSAAQIAAEHGISAYDAAYVAAAQRRGWQLISIDHRDLVSKGLAVTPDAALYP